MIIADTGFFLALASVSDRHHERALAVGARLREPLVTTWPVMTETCHLLATRIGVHAELAYAKSFVDGAFRSFTLSEVHGPRVLELMTRYADLPMDLADASLVVLAEELGSGRILSTDERDFHSYRWKRRKPFRNLLLT